ncbi:MAG: L(+)-tartrate dehydratase subunit beta [Syntrophaceae bacterium PtaU1.Bin231]|nr:MAG: L(+)-tartrate dehydratase subunit beta [Syntrophaceae bacterium PtaU1.Bin231]HOG18599.1 fumarate hydratase C-terminal domain-containing protein [Syntrophales bacterium]HOI15447.1 fumarate hydratase C-terminal domain-containing protein [Geobacteraceae bacterium]
MKDEKASSRKEEGKTIQLETPISEEAVRALRVGDFVEINGTILCGRDAVLPKMVNLAESGDVKVLTLLRGSVIFHTAVSPAGIGPTTSGKLEIEGSIPALSKAGVKVHLGKGALTAETMEALKAHNSVFAVTPPTTAYFSAKMISQKVAMFPEEGMEALYEVKVKGFPAIIAIANGESIFSK